MSKVNVKLITIPHPVHNSISAVSCKVDQSFYIPIGCEPDITIRMIHNIPNNYVVGPRMFQELEKLLQRVLDKHDDKITLFTDVKDIPTGCRYFQATL